MRARQLIDNSTYDPELIAIMRKAFDAAWSEIKVRYPDDLWTVEVARERLAHIVLAVTRRKSNDPEAIKRQTLRLLGLADEDDHPPGYGHARL